MLVSENTPEIIMWGVSQLFMELLAILTAKQGSLFWKTLPFSPDITELRVWRNRRIHGKSNNFSKNYFFPVTINAATWNWNVYDVIEGKHWTMASCRFEIIGSWNRFHIHSHQSFIRSGISHLCEMFKMKFKMEKDIMDAVVAN